MMAIDDTSSTAHDDSRGARRQRAIDAYDGARERASDTLGEAPLLALAGGIAAGALIAALLPRTDTESRLVKPTAKRVKDSARAALDAAKGTGSQRLGELGLNRDRAEQTIRSLISDVTDAARASGQAALDAARDKS